jgi:hypothetical protein
MHCTFSLAASFAVASPGLSGMNAGFVQFCVWTSMHKHATWSVRVTGVVADATNILTTSCPVCH